jgi:hypothetical protein
MSTENTSVTSTSTVVNPAAMHPMHPGMNPAMRMGAMGGSFDAALGDVFLKMIKTNEKFKAEYEVFAPEVFADIQSFSTNPNCTCKNKIKNFVTSDSQKHEAFLSEFVEKNKETLGDLDVQKMKTEVMQENRQRMLNSMGGVVFKIKKSEWADFPARMAKEGIFIRSFSVVAVDEENIEVYILK